MLSTWLSWPQTERAVAHQSHFTACHQKREWEAPTHSEILFWSRTHNRPSGLHHLLCPPDARSPEDWRRFHGHQTSCTHCAKIGADIHLVPMCTRKTL